MNGKLFKMIRILYNLKKDKAVKVYSYPLQKLLESKGYILIAYVRGLKVDITLKGE
jgi:hypothetical protein